MGEFPSGQRGQTVNLLLIASVVRIHLPPPDPHQLWYGFSFAFGRNSRFLDSKSCDFLRRICFDRNRDRNAEILRSKLDSYAPCTERINSVMRLALSFFIPGVAWA